VQGFKRPSLSGDGPDFDKTINTFKEKTVSKFHPQCLIAKALEKSMLGRQVAFPFGIRKNFRGKLVNFQGATELYVS